MAAEAVALPGRRRSPSLGRRSMLPAGIPPVMAPDTPWTTGGECTPSCIPHSGRDNDVSHIRSHNSSQAFTEVSHLSAFTESRSATLTLTRCSVSQVQTPRGTEISHPSAFSVSRSVTRSPTQSSAFGFLEVDGGASGSASARGEGTGRLGARNRRLSAPTRAVPELGGVSDPNSKSASSCPMDSARSRWADNADRKQSAHMDSNRLTSSLARADSKNMTFGELEIQSFAEASRAASTLAGTTNSTISDLTTSQSTCDGLTPDGALIGSLQGSKTPQESPHHERSASRARGQEQDLLDVLIDKGTFEFGGGGLNCLSGGTPSSSSRRRHRGVERTPEVPERRAGDRSRPRSTCGSPAAAPPMKPVRRSDACGPAASSSTPVSLSPARSSQHCEPPGTSALRNDALEDFTRTSGAFSVSAARGSPGTPNHARSTTPGGTRIPNGGSGGRGVLGRSSTLQGLGRSICSTPI